MSLASLLLLSASVAGTLAQTCESFGVDFQQGGSYFQNISSQAPFTFVSVFEGCQNDTANNLLVDPSGNEVMCSDTNLQPDDVNQLSTCPTLKSQLVSGDWSVLIISNNGNGTPIAYERDFTLSVGVPVTITSTPTLTITATTQSVINSTVTTCEQDLETVTVTATPQPAWWLPTITVPVLPKTTTTETHIIGTISETAHHVSSTVDLTTSTATCSVPPKQATVDPHCRITPSLVHAAAMYTSSPQKQFEDKAYDGYSEGTHPVRARRQPDRIVPADRAERLRQRRSRLAHEAANGLRKRAPDSATVTVVDPNTADYPIVTDYITSGTTTMTVTDVSTDFSTTTITKTGGRPHLPIVTKELPTFTLTRFHFTIITETVSTLTHSPSTQVTSTATPTASKRACQSMGGAMV